MKRKRLMHAVVGAGVLVLGLAAGSGVALAASGGGYNPNQNDCAWNADSWATPPNYAPPGCHVFQANVESGGTTNGDANNTNVRYAEFGLNQTPDNENNPSFGYEEQVADPGSPDAVHSGCLAVNDNGTDGGPGVGCGSDPDGTGFEANFDYYQYYCPAAALLPPELFGIGASEGAPALEQCSTDVPPTTTSFTPYTGTDNQLDAILTEGLLLYTGSYDNLDNGEHDGFDGTDSTDGAINGPSDGGGMLVALQPQNATETPSATQPEGVLNGSLGQCADSICAEATTEQQTVYYLSLIHISEPTRP